MQQRPQICGENSYYSQRKQFTRYTNERKGNCKHITQPLQKLKTIKCDNQSWSPICDGVREKGPYLHLVKIKLMESPVSRETTEKNVFCPVQKFQKLTAL